MKVDFNRAALAQTLGLVANVIPARTPKPILRCVHVIAGNDAVRISATDLEVGITCIISDVNVINPGEMVVPADKITSIIRESGDQTLSCEAADGTCRILGSDSDFSIYTQEAAGYPLVPEFEGDADIEILMGDLQVGVQQCIFAAARESTRYAINGILWQAKGRKLSLVATDGRRLARCNVNMSHAGRAVKTLESGQTIVPAKAMALLERVAGRQEQTVRVKFVDNRVLISCEDVVLVSNLVEGNFPQYEDIIPKDYSKKVTLPTGAALSAVRRAALLTSEESRGIKLSLNKGMAIFSSRAPESGEAQVRLAVNYTEDPIEISFSPQFLIDALRVIETEEFTLELSQADRPAMVRSSNDYIYVLMPINLS